MADVYNIVFDTTALVVAGIAAWMLLVSVRNASGRLPLDMVISRLEMPSDEKELLREKLVGQCAEGNRGAWNPQWDEPTGDRK